MSTQATSTKLFTSRPSKATFRAALVSAATLALAATVSPSSASAAAFTYDAYAPKKINASQAQGWANPQQGLLGHPGVL